MHLNDVFPPTNTLSIRYRYPSCVFCISIVSANDCEIVSTCTYKRFGGAWIRTGGAPPPRRSSGCMQVETPPPRRSSGCMQVETPPPRRSSGCRWGGARRRRRGGLVVACRWDAAAAAHMSMGGIAKAVYWKCTLSRPHSFFISLHPIILFLSFSHSYNYFDNIIHTLNDLQVSRCLLTRLY